MFKNTNGGNWNTNSTFFEKQREHVWKFTKVIDVHKKKTSVTIFKNYISKVVLAQYETFCSPYISGSHNYRLILTFPSKSKIVIIINVKLRK